LLDARRTECENSVNVRFQDLRPTSDFREHPQRGIGGRCRYACPALAVVGEPRLRFLVPVIFVAGKRGLAGGLATALFATLGFNFFFVPPAYTLHVADVDNLVTLLALALTAALVSQLSARLKVQAMQAGALAQMSLRLATFTQDLAACGTEPAVRSIAEDRIGAWTGAELCFVDPDNDEALSPLDAAAARWALAHKVEAGRGTDVMAGADALYIPIQESTVPMVAQLWRGTGTVPVPNDSLELVRQMLIRTGVALHRVMLTRDFSMKRCARPFWHLLVMISGRL